MNCFHPSRVAEICLWFEADYVADLLIRKSWSFLPSLIAATSQARSCPATRPGLAGRLRYSGGTFLTLMAHTRRPAARFSRAAGRCLALTTRDSAESSVRPVSGSFWHSESAAALHENEALVVEADQTGSDPCREIDALPRGPDIPAQQDVKSRAVGIAKAAKQSLVAKPDARGLIFYVTIGGDTSDRHFCMRCEPWRLILKPRCRNPGVVRNSAHCLSRAICRPHSGRG